MPILFWMPPGPGGPELCAVRLPPVHAPGAGEQRQRAPEGDAGEWVRQALERQIPGAQVMSEVHPLLPCLGPAGELVIPVWAIARVPAHSTAPLDARIELAKAGNELGDPALPGRLLASVRAEFAADPFAQRILGDDLRIRSLSEAMLALSGNAVPTVIALLPQSFTLAELEHAMYGALVTGGGRPSNSNYRRRVAQFLHSGVLREVPSSRTPIDADRMGRPPRQYEFDREAWRRWLAGHQESVDVPSHWESRWPEDDSSEMQARAARMFVESQLRMRSAVQAAAPVRRSAPIVASRGAHPGHAAHAAPAGIRPTDPGERIERLEQLVAELVRKLNTK